MSIPDHVPATHVIDFDIYHMTDDGTDFFDAWMALQRRDLPDMVWTACNGGHWLPTRGELIHRLFTEANLLSSAVTGVPRSVSVTNFIPLQSDPPVHAAYRAAVMKALGTRRILALEDTIRALTGELIDGFRDAGKCEFIDDFAEQMPFGVFLGLAGLPQSDRLMLRDIGTQLARPRDKTPEEVTTLVLDYLRPYVTERMRNPGTDLLSVIFEVSIDGRAWTLDEAMRVSLNMLIGGLDTVAAMIGFMMHFLARSPSHRAEIRDDPKVIPAAADEFIRRFGMVTNGRVATADFEIGEVTIRQGDIVLLPTMLHNLDDRSFDHAATVDFKRGVRRHSTMGNGIHRCAGAVLAREELIVFLQEWFARIPEFSLDPAGTVVMKSGAVGSLTALPLCWKA